jgi:hypothetical protein
VEKNRIFNPASSSDFMGYSGNDWISPYTYAALMATGDPSPSIGSEPQWVAAYMGTASENLEAERRPGEGLGMERPEWIKWREPVLFLRVAVDGDKVEVFPSFTYAAYRRPR